MRSQVRYTLKTPYRDGTTLVIFEPEDFHAAKSCCTGAQAPRPPDAITRRVRAGEPRTGPGRVPATAYHAAEARRAGGQQKTQRHRQRQHPLAQRALGQHLVGEQRRRLGHAPRAAGGAEAALLAAESHQLLGVALLAAQAQEALLQPAALQAGVELRLDVVGQRLCLPRRAARATRECRSTSRYSSVALGPVARVPGGSTKAGAPPRATACMARVPEAGGDCAGYAAELRY